MRIEPKENFSKCMSTSESVTRVVVAASPGEGQRLRCATLIHPELEGPQPVWRPRFVAGHAPVHQTGVDFGRPSLDLLIRGEIEPVSLHGIYIRTIAEQWPDI